MHNKKKRKKAVVAFLVTLNLAFIILLLLDFKKKPVLNNSGLKKLAYIEFKTNEVKRKLSNSLVWDTIDKGSNIYHKDSVLTLDYSKATIRFSEEDEIEINPNTLIVFEKAKDTFFIDFKKGDIFARSSLKGFKIKYRGEEIELKNTEAQISSSEISVYSGGLSFSGKNIVKGSRLKITKEGVLKIEENKLSSKKAHIKDIKHIKTIFPKEGRIFFSIKRKEKIKLVWEKILLAASYKIIINMQNGDYENVSFARGDNTYTILLPPVGDYLWHVEAYSKKNTLIGFSPQKNFVVKKYPFLSSPSLLFPDRGLNIEFFKDIKLSLKWERITGAKEYMVHLYKLNENKKALIWKKNVKNADIKITLPTPGDYEWGVQSIDENKVKSRNLKFSRFRVIREQPLRAPEKYKISIE